MGPLRYLLDTCVFLWIAAHPSRLSARVRDTLSQVDAELLLSDVSALEISLKWSAGRITLPQPPRAWIEEQSRLWRTSSVAITRAVVFRSTELPAVHRDPFDRLLVATALEEGVAVVTPDEWIQKYPVSWLW
jgi:PIN domain nuclease of toxin-antitoxin system